MLVLGRSDIANLLAVQDVIGVVERAHRALGEGKGAEAPRTPLALPGEDALLIPMVASVEPLGAAGIKVLTDSPGNAARGRPRQQSVILLLDPHSNAVEALIDGAEITMLRTAAASAVATKYLARPDSTTLGLVGAGGLARSHLAAIRAVRPIERVVVWSRSRPTLERFAADSATSGLEIVVADSAREVVAQADVLCTLTPARTPIVEGAWLHEGMHVNAVGAPPRVEYREIDAEMLKRSRVVVDNLTIALAESGAIRHALEHGGLNPASIGDELGDVIVGRAHGRTDDHQITLYNSVGLGVQDIATARLLVTIAREKGIGLEVQLTHSTTETLR